jgi:toxin ParE1/3/4
MPARYRVNIMTRASQDLTDICRFIEQDSPENAASVAQELLDAINSLDILPRRHKVHAYRSNPSRAVHSMPVPPFIVYYRVKDPQEVVEVLRVLHGARRQPRRFP